MLSKNPVVLIILLEANNNLRLEFKEAQDKQTL